MKIFYNKSVKLLIHIAFQFYSALANLEISNCGSETQYKQCLFEENVHTPSLLNCQQIKGNIFGSDIMPITKCPGPAKDLNLSLIKDTNYLLISWRLPHDSSIYNLEGFLLKVTFTYEGKLFELLRSFKIKTDHAKIDDDEVISQVIIKYACIGVFPQTIYHVQLISHPLSIRPSIKESDIYVPTFNFSVTPEETLSGNWKARMWTTIRREGSHFFLTVCFFGAPAKFSMHMYFLFLLLDDDKRFLGDLKVSVDDVEKMDGKQLCGTFANLSENIYVVELLPFGPADCKCEYDLYDDEEPICIDSCSKTIIGPITLQVPEPDHSAVSYTLLIALSGVVLIIAIVILVLICKFAKHTMKKSIVKDRKGKVLIVIIDCVDDHFSASLEKHLERNMFNISKCDLTIIEDDEECPLPRTHPSIQIQAAYNRYLIIHQKSKDCNHLGQPDMANDTILEKTVLKFLKKEFQRDEICIHSLQLNSGSDPKISLKKIIYTLNNQDFVPPDPLIEVDDKNLRLLLQQMNTSSPVLIDFQNNEVHSSFSFVDSGIDSEK